MPKYCKIHAGSELDNGICAECRDGKGKTVEEPKKKKKK